MSLIQHINFGNANSARPLDAAYPYDHQGVGTNSPVVSGGKLDLSGATTRYVTYTQSAAVYASLKQKGTVQFKVTPQYSGSPAELQYFYTQGKANASSDNELLIAQLTDGNIFVRVRDDAASALFSSSLGAWSPVSGTEYSFEFVYDITLGDTRLFIDGVQLGSTITTTGTRGDIGIIRLGNATSEQAYTALMKLDDVSTYDTKLHGDSYAALEPLTCGVYGFIRDLSGAPRSGASIGFTISSGVTTPYAESQSSIVSSRSVSATSGSDGYFKLDLIRSSEFEGGSESYAVTISDSTSTINTLTSGAAVSATIPSQAIVDLSSLITMP